MPYGPKRSEGRVQMNRTNFIERRTTNVAPRTMPTSTFNSQYNGVVLSNDNPHTLTGFVFKHVKTMAKGLYASWMSNGDASETKDQNENPPTPTVADISLAPSRMTQEPTGNNMEGLTSQENRNPNNTTTANNGNLETPPRSQPVSRTTPLTPRVSQLAQQLENVRFSMSEAQYLTEVIQKRVQLNIGEVPDQGLSRLNPSEQMRIYSEAYTFAAQARERYINSATSSYSGSPMRNTMRSARSSSSFPNVAPGGFHRTLTFSDRGSSPPMRPQPSERRSSSRSKRRYVPDYDSEEQLPYGKSPSKRGRSSGRDRYRSQAYNQNSRRHAQREKSHPDRHTSANGYQRQRQHMNYNTGNNNNGQDRRRDAKRERSHSNRHSSANPSRIPRQSLSQRSTHKAMKEQQRRSRSDSRNRHMFPNDIDTRDRSPTRTAKKRVTSALIDTSADIEMRPAQQTTTDPSPNEFKANRESTTSVSPQNIQSNGQNSLETNDKMGKTEIEIDEPIITIAAVETTPTKEIKENSTATTPATAPITKMFSEGGSTIKPKPVKRSPEPYYVTVMRECQHRQKQEYIKRLKRIWSKKKPHKVGGEEKMLARYGRDRWQELYVKMCEKYKFIPFEEAEGRSGEFFPEEEKEGKVKPGKIKNDLFKFLPKPEDQEKKEKPTDNMNILAAQVPGTTTATFSIPPSNTNGTNNTTNTITKNPFTFDSKPTVAITPGKPVGGGFTMPSAVSGLIPNATQSSAFQNTNSAFKFTPPKLQAQQQGLSAFGGNPSSVLKPATTLMDIDQKENNNTFNFTTTPVKSNMQFGQSARTSVPFSFNTSSNKPNTNTFQSTPFGNQSGGQSVFPNSTTGLNANSSGSNTQQAFGGFNSQPKKQMSFGGNNTGGGFNFTPNTNNNSGNGFNMQPNTNNPGGGFNTNNNSGNLNPQASNRSSFTAPNSSGGFSFNAGNGSNGGNVQVSLGKTRRPLVKARRRLTKQ